MPKESEKPTLKMHDRIAFRGAAGELVGHIVRVRDAGYEVSVDNGGLCYVAHGSVTGIVEQAPPKKREVGGITT